ncbi:unnamed protein product [marine sediment metagenome]|uniref:Uncharacterized protein n=1 Tax=marine sediment metagenome TaxID=412755 RepID=X1B648_9ZZZZ
MDLGKAINYKITIEPSHNKGFIVKIGCRIFTFTTSELLINCLDEYLRNPEKWEKEYNESHGGEITENERPQTQSEASDRQPTKSSVSWLRSSISFTFSCQLSVKIIISPLIQG